MKPIFAKHVRLQYELQAKWQLEKKGYWILEFSHDPNQSPVSQHESRESSVTIKSPGIREVPS